MKISKQVKPYIPVSWLNQQQVNKVYNTVKKQDKINFVDLASISPTKVNHTPIEIPRPFLNGLNNMGEHAISYMKKVSEYKQFYESLPTNNKPPFLNLTIGGVNRNTKPRINHDTSSRGYVTYLDDKQKEYVSLIFKQLGCDVEKDKVAISPMRSKVSLQHVFGLFKPSVIVAHKPNYKATIDAAVMNYGHSVVEVDVRNRYSALFNDCLLYTSPSPRD